MTKRHFDGNFTQQDAISEDAVATAVEVMRSGRRHRYNRQGNELPQVARLEQKSPVQA